MIVFNLCCANGHRFEGWFRSSDTYVTQRAAAQVRCPVCESAEINKLLTAPRLNLSAASKEAQAAEAKTAELQSAAAKTADKNTQAGGGNGAANTSNHAAANQAQNSASVPVPVPASLNVTKNQPAIRKRPDGEWDGTPAQQALIENAVRALRRRILDNTEDVGHKFADVARAIHEGDEEARGIRGTVTPKEAEALADDGIAAIPVPEGLLEALPQDEKLH